MSNVLSDEKKQQVLALGRLGWSLRRIEESTGVRRETASAYLRAAGSRSAAGWTAAVWPAKPATTAGVSTDPAAKPAIRRGVHRLWASKPATSEEVSTDSGRPRRPAERRVRARASRFVS